MQDKIMNTEEWLKGQIAFINSTEAKGLNAALKPSLESYDDEKQEITVRFPTEEWEKNGLNMLHGGVSTTMMDLTMSLAVHCYSRASIPPTSSMSVNFQRPLPVPGDVLVTARITSIGRRNATAYCEAINAETGKIGCTCIGTYAIIY